jgi:hypothetical protein
MNAIASTLDPQDAFAAFGEAFSMNKSLGRLRCNLPMFNIRTARFNLLISNDRVRPSKGNKILFKFGRALLLNTWNIDSSVRIHTVNDLFPFRPPSLKVISSERSKPGITVGSPCRSHFTYGALALNVTLQSPRKKITLFWHSFK